MSTPMFRMILEEIIMNERIDFNSYVEIKNQINKECEKLLDESVRLKIKENNLPDFIKYQYEYLYEVMIKNGQIYGAFYQIKDLFEMNIKLPVIIFLSGMTKFIIDNNINANDFGINARYHEKIKDDFILPLPCCPCSIACRWHHRGCIRFRSPSPLPRSG